MYSSLIIVNFVSILISIRIHMIDHNSVNKFFKVLVRYVDNEADTQWSKLLGSGSNGEFNVGFSAIEVYFNDIQSDFTDEYSIFIYIG